VSPLIKQSVGAAVHRVAANYDDCRGRIAFEATMADLEEEIAELFAASNT
jgi:hypothetical protein